MKICENDRFCCCSKYNVIRISNTRRGTKKQMLQKRAPKQYSVASLAQNDTVANKLVQQNSLNRVRIAGATIKNTLKRMYEEEQRMEGVKEKLP